MTKKPTSHFSLSDCRKTLNEHTHPFLSLTMGEYEALVSRLEKAREFLVFYLAEMEGELREVDPTEQGQDSEINQHALRYAKSLSQWLASLERAE